MENDFARKFGATVGVNTGREDAVAKIRELTNGGADFAFDAIGFQKAMEQVLPSVRAAFAEPADAGAGPDVRSSR